MKRALTLFISAGALVLGACGQQQLTELDQPPERQIVDQGGAPATGNARDGGAGGGVADAGNRALDAGLPDASIPVADAGSTTTTSALCKVCTGNKDCGVTGSGNYCVSDPAGGAACGTACVLPTDCPTGFTCYAIGSATVTYGHNCLPSNNASCFGTATTPDAGTTTCTPDTWTNYAHSFFTTYCTGCHYNFGSYSGVSLDSTNIRYYVAQGWMPKGAVLTTAQINQLTRWIDCGMPR